MPSLLHDIFAIGLQEVIIREHKAFEEQDEVRIVVDPHQDSRYIRPLL
jgi:hypothetical protein